MVPPPPAGVTPPQMSVAVRVVCPRKAQKALCRFRLRAVAGKEKGAASESAVARTSVRRGRSKTVELELRPPFMAMLTVAHRILVREVRSIGRATQTETRWFTVVR